MLDAAIWVKYAPTSNHSASDAAMRCPECNHESEAISPATGGLGCCPVCGESWEYAVGGREPREDLGDDGFASIEPIAADDAEPNSADSGWVEEAWESDRWDLEERLREAERLLGELSRGRTTVGPEWTGAAGDLSMATERRFRLDATASLRASRTAEQEPRRKVEFGWLAWLAFMLGVVAVSCGGSLLGWSHFTGRDELWSLGLPIALVGQIWLGIGLVVQIESVRRAHRQTARELEEVDDAVDAIRHRTELLGTTHHSSAQAFYTHLADGACPQVLLTDLKSQLDLLAIKMSEEQSRRRSA